VAAYGTLTSPSGGLTEHACHVLLAGMGEGSGQKTGANFDRIRENVAASFKQGSNCRSVLLFRHSIRGPIPKDPRLRDVPLTPEGVALSRRYGEKVGGRWPIARVLSSPMQRCRQTARGFCDGAGVDVSVDVDSRLGDPGPFVVQADLAWQAYLTLGKHELVDRLTVGDRSLRGFRSIDEGVAILLGCLFETRGDATDRRHRAGYRLTLAFSHDIIMALLLANLRGEVLRRSLWPEFHEGILLTQQGDSGDVMYKGSRIASFEGLRRSPHKDRV